MWQMKQSHEDYVRKYVRNCIFGAKVHMDIRNNLVTFGPIITTLE
jgi:hypothetical protein